MWNSKLLYCYPILLTLWGVAIHFFGVLGLMQKETAQWLHVAFFMFDILVVVGLIKKSAWGYWLAFFLYTEQSIMQLVWASNHGWDLYQLLVVCTRVSIAWAVLTFNKELFVGKYST